MITEKMALETLEKAGYNIKNIHYIDEGSNHYVFDILLDNDKELICKFTKIRETEKDLDDNIDTLFGGKLSLKRQGNIFNIVRNTAKLPAPEVYKILDSPYGEYILLEKMSGMSHKEYLEKENHSLDSFLKSLELLGRDFATLHNSITFPSYGNVEDYNIIEPAGKTNFFDYYKRVLDMRLTRAKEKDMFNDIEYNQVKEFFYNEFNKYYSYLDIKKVPPVLVFTDMHGDNFFVDSNGKPSGYFDLESAQAAPAHLEYYGFRFFLFNYYDEDSFIKGEEAFFKGYKDNNGKYYPKINIDNEIIDLLAALRLLEISQSYWGHIDGLRDDWGKRIKDLIFLYMKTKKVDYIELGNIWRERDKQPEKPNL